MHAPYQSYVHVNQQNLKAERIKGAIGGMQGLEYDLRKFDKKYANLES